MRYPLPRPSKPAVIARLSIAAALLCLTGTARATDYLAATPAAIARVSSAVKQGDTVVLTNGLWNDAQITFRAEGSVAKPIIVRAETPGKVILTGKSWLRIAGNHIIVQDLVFQGCTTDHDLFSFRLDPKEGASTVKKSFSLTLKAHDCELSNCVFMDCEPEDPSRESRWVTVYGTGNHVSKCYLSSKNSPGAMLRVFSGGEVLNHVIEGNHFGRRGRAQGGEAETLRIGDMAAADQTTHVTVDSNLFEECGGEDAIVNQSSGNVFRHNTFKACEGRLSLRLGMNCAVEGNYWLGGTSGVFLSDAGHRVINNYFADLKAPAAAAPVCLAASTPAAAGSVLAFNTFVNCGASLAFVAAEAGPRDCTIACNIFAQCGSSPFALADKLVNPSGADNIVQPGAAGQPATEGIQWVDPRLAADKDGIWRPAAGSPALGTAKSGPTNVTEDIDGQPRGAAKDIGCHQLSGATTPHLLLAAEQCGANWMHQAVPGHQTKRTIGREREVH